MPEMYKALLYLKVNDNLLLVDSIYGEDWNEISELVQGRKRNNPDYLVIISSYNINDAQILG